MATVIGVDGGGTRTRCVVVDDRYGLLASVNDGPSALATSVDRATDVLTTTIREALAIASATWEDQVGARLEIEAACIGLSGAVTTGRDGVVAGRLRRFFVESGHERAALRTEVVSDTEVAFAGALGDRPGICLIVGTGAVALGRDPAGRTVRVDGWGWLLGDYGGGYAIGLAGLRAAFAALDGRGPWTCLVETLPVHFGVSRLEDVVRRVYGETFAPSLIADTVPLIASLAERGDPVCSQIMGKAATDLAETITTAAARLEFHDATLPVVCQGGVIRGVPSLAGRIRETVTRLLPRCEFVDPHAEPVFGAATLAFQLLSKAEGRGTSRKVQFPVSRRTG